MEGAMDIRTVLTNSLSPDAAARNAAETALSQAAGTNFAQYLVILVQELANEDIPGHIRAAAGLALKNAFSAREYARHAELAQKWLIQTEPESKARVKELVLQTLGSSNGQAGQAASQVVAAIASIELPKNMWPDLMASLVHNVSEGSSHQKQTSLIALGYICETQDVELRNALVGYSNAILTAVVQGARKEETNNDVRFAAMTALGDSLEFVGSNFKHEGERNYIMQVICEATQAEDTRIQQSAFGCLNRVMALYYDTMRFYMEKALFGLTIIGMRHADEGVAKLAVEFWSTVCEEEIAIEDDNAQQAGNEEQMRPFYNFSRVATPEVVPVLLGLLMKQDEDAAEDEFNISRAAYQCLCLYAQAVGGTIITPVIQFVEANLGAEDWRKRDAAVSALGAIMDGPDEKLLEPIVKSGMQPLIAMMQDPSLHVRDSTAYALGKITETCTDAINQAQDLEPLIRSLFKGLMSSPKMAASCCWALMNLAERFAGDADACRNPVTAYFNESVQNLLTVTSQLDNEASVRTAAYEVLNTFVANAALDSLGPVAALLDVILTRLQETVPLQSQVVSVEDKITLEDMQTSLCSVLQGIITRLDKEIMPQADHIMNVLLKTLQAVGAKSSVPEAVFAAISSLATAMEEDFVKYMEALSPFLYNALAKQEEPSLCSMAIGLVSDITRSLGERSQPYCDTLMNYLLENLRSPTLSNQFKPAILQSFGDIASAIGGHFEKYLAVVAGVLQQASSIAVAADDSFEMFDYVICLREGIMDAWSGIINALKSSGQTHVLLPYVPSIFQLLNAIHMDMNRSEALLRASMGVIGDLAEAFPGGELCEHFGHDWLASFVKHVKTNRDFLSRTTETARWAREQVKRQVAMGPAAGQTVENPASRH